MSFFESELHLAYKFGNAPINSFPFPHLYVQDIFPDIFYSQIQKNLPAQNLLTSLPDLFPDQPGFRNYKDRYVMDVNKNESITYGDLNHYVNQVANFLLDNKISHKSNVCINLEKSAVAGDPLFMEHIPADHYLFETLDQSTLNYPIRVEY